MTPHDMAESVARALSKRGFNVIVDDMTPRPWTFQPKGVILHHTASTSTTGIPQEKADVYNLKHGDEEWPAPHVQWFVGRTGRIYLIAKGGANHAGLGVGLIDHGIPENEANRYMWGIEAQSDGYGLDWTKEEWASVHALTGELLKVMNADVNMVWRHKDYYSGKVDTRYPLDSHREAVRQYLNNKETDEMTADDFQKIRDIIKEELVAERPKTVEAVLDSDVTPKDSKVHVSAREALRKAAEK